MTYQEEYTSLIEHAKSTTPQHKGYGIERHHIVPRCMGGTDDESNLVFLTYEQHINAHILLWKAHPTNGKLAGAVCSMLALTGTTSKSASARVEFLETLNDAEREVFISAVSDARAEKHLPWNTSGFPKDFCGMSKYLSIDVIKRDCDKIIELYGKLPVVNFVGVVDRNKWLYRGNMQNMHSKFSPSAIKYYTTDVFEKYRIYGRDLIVERMVAVMIKDVFGSHKIQQLKSSNGKTERRKSCMNIFNMMHERDAVGICVECERLWRGDYYRMVCGLRNYLKLLSPSQLPFMHNNFDIERTYVFECMVLQYKNNNTISTSSKLMPLSTNETRRLVMALVNRIKKRGDFVTVFECSVEHLSLIKLIMENYKNESI